jgi:hypothetical protein
VGYGGVEAVLRYWVSLTLSYFHAGCRTIIGAKSFHGPVRDGKGWGQLAMGVKLKGVHAGVVDGSRTTSAVREEVRNWAKIELLFSQTV